jgi:hypothetical protein
LNNSLIKKIKAALSGFFYAIISGNKQKKALQLGRALEVLSGFQDATVSTFAAFAELI